MKETELFQALSSFAGRVASSNNPEVHQNAGKQLQAELKKLNTRSCNTPTANLNPNNSPISSS